MQHTDPYGNILNELETLTIKDICRIFHVAEVSVYRWVKEARLGKSQFPLPINGMLQGKRKLLWSRNAIIAFQNANSPQPPIVIESATQRKKRHTAAMDSLSRMGVNIHQSQGEA